VKAFHWSRAAFAFALVDLALSLPSLRPNFEPAGLDDSPFAEVWAVCDRVVLGWPFTVLRRAADIQAGCPGLPDVDFLALSMDLAFVGTISGFVAFLVGTFPWRRNVNVSPTP
jgi:hypothetical protein